MASEIQPTESKRVSGMASREQNLTPTTPHFIHLPGPGRHPQSREQTSLLSDTAGSESLEAEGLSPDT